MEKASNFGRDILLTLIVAKDMNELSLRRTGTYDNSKVDPCEMRDGGEATRKEPPKSARRPTRTPFLQAVLKMIEERHIAYSRGEHDDFENEINGTLLHQCITSGRVINMQFP